MIADHLLKSAATRLAKELFASARQGHYSRIKSIAEQLGRGRGKGMYPDEMKHIMAFNMIDGHHSPSLNKHMALADVAEKGYRSSVKDFKEGDRSNLNYRDRFAAEVASAQSWSTPPKDVKSSLQSHVNSIRHNRLKVSDPRTNKYKKAPQPWSPEGGIDPEQWVQVTHSGGLGHIRKFVKGEATGYRLEGGIAPTGIQVHPLHNTSDNWKDNIKSRDNQVYSTHGLTRHIDQPGRLTAEIQAKHLLKAPNQYEAGLPADAAQHMRNVQTTNLPWSHSQLGSAPSGTDKIIQRTNERYGLHTPTYASTNTPALTKVRY